MNILKNYRKNCRLTQKYVGQYLGVTPSQYHRLESGKSLLNSKQILQLCQLYKCSPNDLLGFRGEHIFYMGQMDNEV